MPKYGLAALFAALSIFAFSCTKENSVPEPEQPECYRAVVDACLAGEKFFNVDVTDESTVFSLKSGSQLVIPSSQIPVDDCRKKVPAVVALAIEGNEWMVAGKLTGIHKKTDVPYADALPVYAYFDSDRFKMTISTGNTLVMVRINPEPEQPECYSRLLAAAASGKKATNIIMKTGILSIVFADLSTLDIPAGQIVVDDCRNKAPRTVAVSDGEWKIDGQPTGVWDHPDYSDADALPVYSYITTGAFVMKLSNGSELSIVIDYVDIPKVYLSTVGKAPVTSKEDYVDGTIRLEDPDNTFKGMDGFEAPMKIRGRGNSTWGMPKKPYKIKLESKERLFGMSKDKEWCILANYCDKTLVRNMTAMEISRRLGFSWTPKMTPVEVWLNDKYIGVYTFTEHKKVSTERVNIDLDRGDLLFEIEQQQDEPVSWWTEHSCPMMFSEPSEPTQEQIDYAKGYFKDFEDALWAKNFSKVYEMIDAKSFVDNFIIQELTKNCDGNLRKSSFLTLEVGGKLEFYHVWDFDISMGNCDYYGTPPGNGPTGWWVKNNSAIGFNHGWYYRLFMDPNFVKMVQDRWKEVYSELQTIPDYIDVAVAGMGDAPSRNFKTWKILGQYVWPNYKVFKTYAEEVDWLKQFYSERLEWMDREIAKLK